MADGQVPALGETGQGFVPVMGNISNFGFMNNPALMDPMMQQAMARQQYASSLISQGMETTPLRSPWQAAARALQGALGGYFMGNAQDLMQQYALGSRQALADSYAQQPIPQLPQVGQDGAPGAAPAAPVRTGGQMQPVGGGAGAASPSGAIDPASLLPKQQALQAVVDRESGGQNIVSKIPLTPEQIKAGYTEMSKGSGLFQMIPSTWAHGQELAGIPPAQRTQYAIQADPATQWKVAGALYDESGLANWRQSSNTKFVSPGSVQPGDSSYAAIQAASKAAADYGVSLAQQYRQMAINAAQSPYAAVRAMAPHYQEQSLGYLQYGRFSPVGIDPNGQIQMIDRLSGEVKTVGAPLQVHTDPRTGALITSTGGTVAQGIPPVGSGGGGGGGPGGGGGNAGTVGGPGAVQLAQQSGVPVAPGNPYAGMATPDQQKALYEDRTRANTELTASDAEATNARTQLINLQRMQQIAATNPSWLGTGPTAAAARTWAWAHGDQLYQEYLGLQNGLIPAEKMGTGIARVTNKDMGIFETMIPSMEMGGDALNNSLQAHLRLANQTLEANRFQHDYVDVNGSLRGAPGAWDSYVNANPVFTQDQKTGVYHPNQNWQTHRQWFQANTDPSTGLLLPGSRSADPAQAPPAPQGQPGQQQAQTPPAPQTITTQGDALPQTVGPARTVIHDPATGRTFMSDGQRWVPVQVPK